MEYEVKCDQDLRNVKKHEKTMEGIKNKESEEYIEVAKKYDAAKLQLNRDTAMLDDIKEYIERYSNVEIPDDLKEIVEVYSTIYSRADSIEISENGVLSLKKSTLRGAYGLYRECCDYMDKYETTADVWSQERKDDFNRLKDILVSVGDRIDGEKTDNRNGFKYSVTAKDISRLTSLCSRKHMPNKKKGGTKDPRIEKYRGFEISVVGAIFRTDSNSVQKKTIVER